MEMEPKEIALAAARALEEKLGADIRIYDVRKVSSITDFTVVATGNSSPHLKALIAEVQRQMKEANVMSYRTSGEPESGWVIVDYVHVVVHVFSPEARAYYAIEKLWTDAPLIEFEGNA